MPQVNKNTTQRTAASFYRIDLPPRSIVSSGKIKKRANWRQRHSSHVLVNDFNSVPPKLGATPKSYTRTVDLCIDRTIHNDSTSSKMSASNTFCAHIITFFESADKYQPSMVRSALLNKKGSSCKIGLHPARCNNPIKKETLHYGLYPD